MVTKKCQDGYKWLQNGYRENSLYIKWFENVYIRIFARFGEMTIKKVFVNFIILSQKIY